MIQIMYRKSTLIENTCDRREKYSNQQCKRCRNIRHNLIVRFTSYVLNINWILTIRYKLSFFQKGWHNIVIENTAGKTLDSFYLGNVIIWVQILNLNNIYAFWKNKYNYFESIHRIFGPGSTYCITLDLLLYIFQ